MALKRIDMMWPVYQRAPVREFAPSCCCALQQTERLARGGIRALRARQEDGSREDGLAGGEVIQWETRGPIGRDWPLQTRSLHAVGPPLHSRLARSLPAHPRHSKVAVFRCSPLRSLFRGDRLGWSYCYRAAREQLCCLSTKLLSG